jgi:ferric-dicitrate binding protein FerR (iron transport regulator)
MREEVMNERGHLSEDVLLDAIYGIADAESEAHAHTCAECAARVSEWRERAGVITNSEISDEFLAAQRRQIYARIEGSSLPMSRRVWWWAPALAMAAALIVGIVVWPQHRVAPANSHAEVSDVQLFNEVYSFERSAEPSATAPVHALFEDQAQ